MDMEREKKIFEGMFGRNHLPNLIADIAEGEIVWKSVESVDFELLGYFLSCHLVIEHYMETLLAVKYADLDWEASKLTFGQRLALLVPDLAATPKYDCAPAIKHMNTLRNRISHRVDYAIDQDALLPFVQFIEKMSGKKAASPMSAKETLKIFTLMCCSILGGSISGSALRTKNRR